MNSFKVVEQFEQRVAEYARAKHGVAVNTCTSAIFLSLRYRYDSNPKLMIGGPPPVYIPARTFISVPMAIRYAGGWPVFHGHAWEGVYTLDPLGIVDGALRFTKGMYRGGLHCLSFHARKHLNIGEGGMVLTDDAAAAEWLRAARYSGRRAPHYRVEEVDMLGWQFYMTPEKAARGLHLMDYVKDDNPDQRVVYPDLRQVPFFAKEHI